MENDNSYAVSNLVVRQTPLVTANGQVQNTTTVSFNVGPHGPFTLSWPGTNPTAAEITKDIQSKVAEIRNLGAAIKQINAQS